MTPVQEFISIARGFVGTKEEPLGSNRGFHIDVWNTAIESYRMNNHQVYQQ